MNAPEGCVTTAVGQIMSYHGWPERWSVVYYDYNHSLEKYEFDWSVLKYKRTDDKLARLIEILGRGHHLNAIYRDDGSPVDRSRIRDTFFVGRSLIFGISSAMGFVICSVIQPLLAADELLRKSAYASRSPSSSSIV